MVTIKVMALPFKVSNRKMAGIVGEWTGLVDLKNSSHKIKINTIMALFRMFLKLFPRELPSFSLESSHPRFEITVKLV